MMLSAGGSAFFDRVGERFERGVVRPALLRVLRSGCYLTHDSIGYAAAFRRIVAETTLHLPEGGLEPALEVWAYVQSRPENGRTILTMGKRDVSYDSALPVPLRWFRPDGTMDRPSRCRGAMWSSPSTTSIAISARRAKARFRSATWSASASAIPARPSTNGLC